MSISTANMSTANNDNDEMHKVDFDSIEDVIYEEDDAVEGY